MLSPFELAKVTNLTQANRVEGEKKVEQKTPEQLIQSQQRSGSCRHGCRRASEGARERESATYALPVAVEVVIHVLLLYGDVCIVKRNNNKSKGWCQRLECQDEMKTGGRPPITAGVIDGEREKRWMAGGKGVEGVGFWHG